MMRGVNPVILKLEVVLFLVVWLSCGAAINSNNLNAFNLQQVGVEAIVERQTFYLEGSPTTQLQLRGDVFAYQGHRYAAKQPGQFMLGALAYFPLHKLGLRYSNNFLLTSALVTFLTASLLTAVASIVVFRLAVELSTLHSKLLLLWPILAALSYGLATTAFAYSGIAHHDAISSSFLIIAFYFAFRFSRSTPDAATTTTDTTVSQRRQTMRAICAGLFLGLSITTSMLPFFMAVVVGVYFLSHGIWQSQSKYVAIFLAGGFWGLTPLLFYNAVSFGNPLLMPNMAGNYADTFFQLAWTNFADKLGFYARMLLYYVPIAVLGLIGLGLLPARFRREQMTIFLLIGVLCAYVFNISTVGHCQYGPRYMLPVMPFACLGLVGFSGLTNRVIRRFIILVVIVAGLFSLAVNLVGALHGAMYCDLGNHAFWSHLAKIKHSSGGGGGGDAHTAYPLAWWLLIPQIACLWWLLVVAEVERQRLRIKN